MAARDEPTLINMITRVVAGLYLFYRYTRDASVCHKDHLSCRKYWHSIGQDCSSCLRCVSSLCKKRKKELMSILDIAIYEFYVKDRCRLFIHFIFIVTINNSTALTLLKFKFLSLYRCLKYFIPYPEKKM